MADRERRPRTPAATWRPWVAQTSDADRLGRAAAALGLPGWRPWEVAGAALGLLVLLYLGPRVDLIWARAPLLVIVAALVSAGLLVRRVPVAVAILWLLGLLSCVWSLAPGDTLLASLWGLTMLAAAAAGRFRAGLALSVAVLTVDALQNALSLNAFGLQKYLSGSVHYRMGAVALVALALAVGGLVQSRRRWLVGAWWLLATVAAFGALMSGSRGVYVPLLAVIALAVFRAVRQRRGLTRLLLGLAAAAVLIVATDRAVPFHPVAEALSSKASLEAQVAAAGTAGGFTLRLRYWDQGLGMALSHPLGVGLGAFRGTIHAFQRFPMVWSSSPHDVFVETAATLGWPGLALLLGVLMASFWRAWTSSRWPWALALLGIWFTLSVDVTADYPAMTGLAFATLGACLGAGEGRPARQSTGIVGRALGGSRVTLVALLAGVALAGWWFAPCAGPQCSLTRYRGAEDRVLRAAPEVPPASRPAYFGRLERLYPQSLWVLQLEQKEAPSQQTRLRLAREIAQRFPLESWRNYLDWADLSLQAGDLAQAKEAVRAGLAIFGPGSTRYPEMRADPQGFQQWLSRARAILAMTSAPTGKGP